MILLWFVGFFLAGKPPKFDATPAEVVHYYATHHDRVLLAVILVAIGIVIYLAILAQLSVVLRDAGEPALALVVLLGAGASAAVFSIGDAIYGVIAQVVLSPGADPGLASALYQLDQFAGVPMYWLVFVSVVSVTIAGRRGVFPAPTVWLNTLLSILVVVGGISVKSTGPFAAGTGAMARIAFAASLVFLLEVGVLVRTSPRTAAAPAVPA